MGSVRGGAGRESWTAELPQAAREFLAGGEVVWEPVNEGAVRTFARYVREFAGEQEEAVLAGLRVVTGLVDHVRGPEYEALAAAYREAAEGRLAEVVRAARACADRLDVAAEVIAVEQSEVVAELTALAADRTRPAPSRLAAARRRIASMEGHLEQYVVDQVNEGAIGRLLVVVERASRAPEEPGEGELRAACGGGGEGEPVPDEVLRAAGELRRLQERLPLLTEAFLARLATVDFEAPAGPDDGLLGEFLIDRGTAVAVFGADRMVTLDERGPDGIGHRPTRVFLREVGLPDDTVFFDLARGVRDGEPATWEESWAPHVQPFDAVHWMHLGEYNTDTYHLDTATGEVYCVPEEAAPHLVASSLDRFVLALAALEAERPFYDPDRQRFEDLDPDGVQERFLALLRRTDPGVPTGPGSHWVRVLEHVHKALNCY
ncbi:SUKH-4 family immunity protein [Kitasatospora sp. NPDC001540]|uniref:SUKH-4 family immunity protein n=1 Tax=Kitasatospora sp. NPDC001540 TaxID=3364014 RepID=UPI0036A06BDF